MDPIIIVMIVQTVVFTITLLVLIFQVKNQIKTVHEDAYWRCQDDYWSLIKMLTQHGELRTIYDDITGKSSTIYRWSKYSERDKLLYCFLELYYGLFERTFIMWKHDYIDQKTWNGWDLWLKETCYHPIFIDVHKDNKGMFDMDFQKHVDEKISKIRPTSPNTA